RDAANRSAAIVSISSIQKAVRGFENINLRNDGDACVAATDIAPFFNNVLPTDPSNNNNAFNYQAVIPTVGAAFPTNLYATSGNAPTQTQIKGMNTASW